MEEAEEGVHPHLLAPQVQHQAQEPAQDQAQAQEPAQEPAQDLVQIRQEEILLL